MSSDQGMNFDLRPGVASVPEREARAAKAEDARKETRDELVRVRCVLYDLAAAVAADHQQSAQPPESQRPSE